MDTHADRLPRLTLKAGRWAGCKAGPSASHSLHGVAFLPWNQPPSLQAIVARACPRHRCGHDGQRKRVAHMPTATAAKEDSSSKMVQNHPHDFTKRQLDFGRYRYPSWQRSQYIYSTWQCSFVTPSSVTCGQCREHGRTIPLADHKPLGSVPGVIFFSTVTSTPQTLAR